MKKIYLLLALALLICCIDVKEIYAKENSTYYHSVLYDSYVGLPTSQANDVLQTKDGQIWIGSYSALLRYDGRRFISYAHRGVSGVMCLFEDSKERLWIGTNNDGTMLYEDKTIKTTAKNQVLESYSTRAITENKAGDIIIGTKMGLYTILEDHSLKRFEDPLLHSIYVIKLESYGDNFTVGLTKRGDIFILQGLELVKYITAEEFGFNSPLSILPLDEDNNNFLLGTTDEYLVKMSKKNTNSLDFSFTKIPINNVYHINDIVKDSKGRIWLASDTHVAILDENYKPTILDYISVSSFENIFEDVEGNFWLASGREGLLKLTESPFRNITAVLGNLIQVNGVELLDDLLYIVSPVGINIIDNITGKEVNNELTRRYKDAYFRCVEKDNVGNLWFSSYTNDQLIKYTPSTGKITPITEAHGLTNNRIRSTMVAKDGKVWVGTGNGAYVIENDKVVNYYGREAGIHNLEILSITEDLKGRIFLSTDGSGVYILENGKIVHNISRFNGLTTEVVLRTETDPHNGGTWIISGNSLSFYDTDKDELHIIKNFPYSNNFDLLFYGEEIAILSSNGVYLTTAEELIKGKDSTFVYQFKNHLDGLHSNPVANSFSKIYDGILYICGYQNLTSYDLDVASSTKKYAPQISLPRIYVNKEAYYPFSDKYYELPSTANYLELDVLIPTFSLQDYDVSYAIKNYDKMPHIASYQNFTNPNYTNLPGGTYTLVVDVIDARSKQIISSEEFTIKKEYSFFENPIVRSLTLYGGILLIVLLTYLFNKKRVEKIQKQRQVFTNIFKEMVEMLSKIIDKKDTYTQGHSSRVGHYSKVISKAMGFNEEEQFFVYGTGLLHDIGKISISDAILNKNGKLEPQEFEIIKTHPTNGAEILESIKSWPELHLGAGYHHERYDGKGYQNKLGGDNIPLIARIICVADAFDAMYSSRVYRKKMELADVLSELENNAGTQFDPKVVKVFLELLRSGDLDELLAELNPK